MHGIIKFSIYNSEAQMNWAESAHIVFQVNGVEGNLKLQAMITDFVASLPKPWAARVEVESDQPQNFQFVSFIDSDGNVVPGKQA